MLRCSICQRIPRKRVGATCHGCGKIWCKYCSIRTMTIFKYGKKDACILCWPKGKPYKCKACPKGTCLSDQCWVVLLNYVKDGHIHRGVCCRGRGHKDRVCVNCEVWETRKACIIMIGTRKFKKSTILSTLPKDVLIYALLKPFVWPNRSRERVNTKELKKLKGK